ncbi:MAG TPA: hypothetical protein VE074_09665 [Jatrophihabitantaceae bacterium]|nr:hypothetical protein [Jatrophihabitantaceae bacterium]
MTEETLAPQGDLRLLNSAVAQRLLSSSIPARYAYIASDGTPRILSSWFHWTGDELVMPTFIAAPHARHPARRINALRARPDIAVSIDTETSPPEVLLLRGQATVTEVDGIPTEYAQAAARYLGSEAAGPYLAMIDQPGTRMARISLRPSWVGVVDFRSRLPSALPV